MPRRIESYTELEEFLANWANWADDRGPYDLGGMVALLAACLDNLRENAIEEDLSELGLRLTYPQREFLERLAVQAARCIGIDDVVVYGDRMVSQQLNVEGTLTTSGEFCWLASDIEPRLDPKACLRLEHPELAARLFALLPPAGRQNLVRWSEARVRGTLTRPADADQPFTFAEIQWVELDGPSVWERILLGGDSTGLDRGMRA